jgi:hypothetical protein
MYFSARAIRIFFISLLVFTFFEVYTDLYFLSGIGVALFAGVAVKFFEDLGNRIEIRDMIAFMSVLQWVIGPILAYNLLPYDELYYMSVPEEVYMGYIVPFCFAMILGLYFPLADERIINFEDITRLKTYLAENPMIGYVFTVVGLAAGFAGHYLPRSLTFLMFLLTNLQYVGVYMILFGTSKFKWLLFAGIMGLATSAAVLQGMFGELVQWFMLSFLIVAIVVKIPMWAKISLISVGMFLISLIQSTKEEYRMATWYAESTKSNSEIYQEIMISRLSNPSMLFQAGTMQNLGARLNQGWIIARIMEHMPDKLQFVRGETVQTALMAALLPRILAPNKAQAGGRANFERFTGTPLPETTSMDISLAGEGYANFGVMGGCAFIFLVSLFYNLLIIKIISISKNHPSLILWIPFLFFQVMKAETDFATVFNYITKAVLVCWLVFYTQKVIMGLLEKKKKISVAANRPIREQ